MKLTAENMALFQERLAEIRTKQANERTLLAYMRTSLTLVVGGLSFIQFFDSRIIELVGWIFIPFGALTMVIGVIRYHSVRRHLKAHDI